MGALTSADFEAHLARRGLAIEVVRFDTPTATSQQAADAIGCELGQIAKSLAFVVDDQPILVIASGDQRVDDRKLAAIFGVTRRRVRIATPEQCVEIYGYAPGGVPPFGHATVGLRVLVDDSLTRYADLFAAAGAPDAIFAVTFDELVRLSGGELADVKRDQA